MFIRYKSSNLSCTPYAINIYIKFVYIDNLSTVNICTKQVYYRRTLSACTRLSFLPSSFPSPSSSLCRLSLYLTMSSVYLIDALSM